jgi:hypothetical protein
VNQLGFTLVYLGFAYGIVSVGWFGAAIGKTDPRPRSWRPAEWVIVAGSIVAVASLWLPWIEGVQPGGAFVVQSAWIALDPLSLGGLTVLAACSAVLVGLAGRGGRDRPWVMASLGACVVALAAGNVLIQATTTRGSHLRVGGYAAAIGAGLTLVGAVALVLAVRTEEPD